MRRRAFVLVLGGAITAVREARARQKVMSVIGFLSASSPVPFAPYVAAFRQGLGEAGYVEGRNVTTEYRWADNHYDRMPALADDLVGRKVDVIVAGGGSNGIAAAKGATSTIPIVVFGGGDLVAAGIVASLARPGGNLTGISIFDRELNPKRLQLLSELVPQVEVIALLVNPTGYSGSESADARHGGSSPHEWASARCLEGQHGKRDRCGFGYSHPTARRRTRRRVRSVLQFSARAARGAGGTPYRSGDL